MMNFTKILYEEVKKWNDGEPITPQEINSGYCADFADNLYREYKDYGLKIEGIYEEEDLNDLNHI